MAMFEDADRYNRGAITYEALKSQLEKHGGLLENLSISIDRWLVPLPAATKPPKRTALLDRLPHHFTAAYVKNNYVFLVFLAVYIVINASLFVSRAIQYRDHNGFVIVARACGESLAFALIDRGAGRFATNRCCCRRFHSRTVPELQLCLRARADAAQMHHVPADARIR